MSVALKKSSKPKKAEKLVPVPGQPINNGLIDIEEVVRKRENLQLRPYQLENLGFMLKEPRAIDRSEAGTGKTPVMCLWLYSRSQDGRCVWTMPKSLMAKNYEELLLWSNLTPEEIIIVDGTPAQREAQMKWSKAKVFIMGFECFANNWDILRALYPNLVHFCADEMHKGFSTHGQRHWKNPDKFVGTRRTVMFYEYMMKGGDMLATTGTIINGRLTSAFPIIKAINPLYYPTYENFLSWHAILDDWGKPAYWKNHDRLSQILDKHGKRITYEQAYGAEAKEQFVIKCHMGKKQRHAYKEFEEKAIIELDDGQLLEAPQAGVAVRRCLEIMQIPEKYGLLEDNDNGKEARLLDEAETAEFEGEQLLIFEPIKAAQYKWRDLLVKAGRRAEVMNGDVTGNARMWQDKNFRSGQIQDLVCSPDVAGVGFNWEHVNTVLFMCLDYQDTTFIQNYRRAMRGTRTKPLRILILQYVGTIDLDIARKLNEKSFHRTKVEAGTSIKI